MTNQNDHTSLIQRRLVSVGKVLLICLALDFFFVSIQLLGAFREFGSGYGEDLIIQLADNPIIGLLIGILVTSIAQSSSVTTSLVVGLVAAGALGSDPAQALVRAVPIIMGANVGTTITNTLVSTAHIGVRSEYERAFSAAVVHDMFNVIAIFIFLPLQIFTNFLGRSSLFLADLFTHTGGLKFGSPLKALVNPQKKFFVTLFQDKDWISLLIIFVVVVAFFQAMTFLVRRTQEKKGVLVFTVFFGLIFAALGTGIIRHTDTFFRPEAAIMILGLGLLFGSLTVFVKVMRSAVLTGLEVLIHNYIFKTALRALVLGMIITAIVQSSSVTTSIVIPLAGAGILTIRQVFPYTLGANVGTTITAILAALSTGETIAMAVAFSHLLFNVLGILFLYPVRRIPIFLSQGLAGLTLRSRLIPFLYIILVFFIIPFCLIWISR